MSDSSDVKRQRSGDQIVTTGDLFSRVSLAPFIVVFGLVLAIATAVGMRSIESSKAEVDYSSDLLRSSVRIEGDLGRAADAMDALTETMRGNLTSAGAVEQYLKGAGLLAVDAEAQATATAGTEPVLAAAGTRRTDDGLEISALILPSGVTDPDVTIDFGRDKLFAALIERLVPGETIIGESSTVGSLLGDTSDDDGTKLVIARQSTVDDTFIGFAVVDFNESTIPFAWDLPPVDLQVLLNGQATLGDKVPTDQIFGEPYDFEALGAEWSIVGLQSGVEADHSGSWLLLFAGVLFAGAAGLLAQAIRRQSIVLGRLDRTEHDATHDPLTGLLNRSGLTPDLEARLSDRRANNLVGVLFLDLDRLKVVNDSLGHSAGDEVLAIVADRLRSVVREGDIVARFGGDEFVVVSSGLPAIRDLTTLAQRVLDALAKPALLSDESSQMIGGSIGIAYVTKGNATAESLLRDADLAMYRAKEGGGGRYEVFDAELRAAALARLEVERASSGDPDRPVGRSLPADRRRRHGQGHQTRGACALATPREGHDSAWRFPLRGC
ncbi:MAG: GGDEF domain-containing protein [Acidimicrobiales bacterium]